MRLFTLSSLLCLFFVSLLSYPASAYGSVAAYLVICEERFHAVSSEHAQMLSAHHPLYDTLDISVVSLIQIAQSQTGHQPRTYKQPPTMVLEASPGLSLPDSAAIRRYVRNWFNSLPSYERDCSKYLLLVGKGVPSYRFVPRKAPLRRWEPWIAYDDPYGDLDGDGELEVAVARVCPSNSTDLKRWSDKVRHLMSLEPDDPFHRKVLVLAEDGFINDEDGVYVHDWAEHMAQKKLPWYLAEKTVVYARDVDPLLRPHYLQHYILPIFNQGYGLLIGIGTYSSEYDFVDFFSTEYAGLTSAMLTNRGKYSVVLGFCCQVGQWVDTYPYDEVLDVMNFADSAGTVLWIAPTAVTMQEQSRWLLDTVLDNVFWTNRYPTWGQAFVAAKNHWQWFTFEREIWWEYGMFGEPSLPVRCGLGEPAGVSDSVVTDSLVTAKANLLVLNNLVRDGFARVNFDVGAAGECQVRIYDVQGRLIRELFDRVAEAPGKVSLEWDCHDQERRKVSPGIYFVRLTTSKGARTAKVVVLR